MAAKFSWANENRASDEIIVLPVLYGVEPRLRMVNRSYMKVLLRSLTRAYRET